VRATPTEARIRACACPKSLSHRTEKSVKATNITELMSKEVLGVDDDWQLADFFVEHPSSGAPVLDEHGDLVGVVS
jgi:predicted transcriptional regulator